MPKRCLVADDSAVIRKVARRILEAQAYEVADAGDPSETLGACKVSMPDAILLDASMHDVDSIDVLKAIRGLPNGGYPKIVYCLLENDVGQIQRAKQTGANEIILKPFDKATLLQKFRDAGLT
jgi:two-component system, chemotaxis family, chemotaxis protein CheY